jgi:hypothetical protein
MRTKAGVIVNPSKIPENYVKSISVQSQTYGRRAGLKSGPRKGGVGSSPTLGISGLGRTATTMIAPEHSLTPPHDRQCIDNHCPAIAERRSRPGSGLRSGVLVIIPMLEAGSAGIACLNSSARGKGGDKWGVHETDDTVRSLTLAPFRLRCTSRPIVMAPPPTCLLRQTKNQGCPREAHEEYFYRP